MFSTTRHNTDDNAWLLNRYLTYQLTEILRRKQPALPFADGTFVPDVGNLPSGMEAIAISLIQEYGEAAFLGANTEDIPLAEVSLNEDKFKSVCVVAGAQYNQKEIDAIQFASSQGQAAAGMLNDLRIERMYRMIDEKINKTIAFGNVPHGIQGFLNNPNVPLATSTFNPYTETNQQLIIDWFASNYAGIRDITNMIENINVILLPDKLFIKLATTFRSTNSDLTLLDSIRKIMPGVAIGSANELKSNLLEAEGVQAPNTNRDRIVMYNLDPANLVKYSGPLQTMPIQVEGFNYKIFGYKSFSSVYWKYPLSARYLDFPKAP